MIKIILDWFITNWQLIFGIIGVIGVLSSIIFGLIHYISKVVNEKNRTKLIKTAKLTEGYHSPNGISVSFIDNVTNKKYHKKFIRGQEVALTRYEYQLLKDKYEKFPFEYKKYTQQ